MRLKREGQKQMRLISTADLEKSYPTQLISSLIRMPLPAESSMMVGLAYPNIVRSFPTIGISHQMTTGQARHRAAMCGSNCRFASPNA